MNSTTTTLLVGEEPTIVAYDPTEIDQPELNHDNTDPRAGAKAAFAADPTKCFQRHLCDSYDELEARPRITTPVKHAQVKLITNQQAAELVTKYEYLGTMATATKASYGLFLDRELLGVACFAAGTGSPEFLRLTDCPASPILLARGVCLPHAPEHSASYLVRSACRLAHEQFSWDVFFAYSDPAAGEVGTIYQALGWRFIGWPKQGIKKSFVSPNGDIVISSYNFNKRSEGKFLALGWDAIEPKYAFLRRLGFSERTESIKGKYVWFEGTRRRKRELEKSCRFPALLYPKRPPVSDTGGEGSALFANKMPVQSVGIDELGEDKPMAAD
jgi:hypothetical protein